MRLRTLVTYPELARHAHIPPPFPSEKIESSRRRQLIAEAETRRIEVETFAL